METSCSDLLFHDLAGLRDFAREKWVDLGCDNCCFRLQKLGEPTFCPDSVLIRARVLEQCTFSLHNERIENLYKLEAGHVVALRLRTSDWYTLISHVDSFKALWAQTRCKDKVVVLDAMVGHFFLSGYIPLQNNETVRVAEMFSGGFCGWSQAAYCLHEFGVNLRTTWFLDKDPAVLETTSIAHPGVKAIQGPSGFDEVDFPSEQALIIADIQDSWWQNIWALSTPDILAASPPCQLWSVARKQGGLATPDGALFPLLAKIAGCSQVPVVCVE